ncbi:MAG TPA: SCO family protein [Pyrinomonadaceae bacterium]|nr:SCO family protein [Pyrinomonadaceae bacterium]
MNIKLNVPDVEVTDQNGKKLRLYQDLVKDKLVVIGTFFTRCNYVCAGVGRNFAGLQKKLGDRLGKEVNLILLTRDPKVDSPERLRQWGRKYGARSGWTLLTADEATMRKLIAFFATDLLGPADNHSDRIFIGNESAGAWIVTAGLSPPEQLIKFIDELPSRP